MAIDRAPWNALVDDDGSNLIGTVWNKDKIKTVILDPVDAAFGRPIVSNNTQSGTINDWAIPGLAPGANAVVTWTGTANLIVTGIAGGVAGQVLTILSRSTSAVISFAFFSAASAAPNKMIMTATSGPTPLGFNGVIQFYYTGTLWLMLHHEQGSWIRPPYLASRYTADVGSWVVEAGDQIEYAYWLKGSTLFFSGEVGTSSLSGTPTVLSIALPEAYTIARGGTIPIIWAPTSPPKKLGMCLVVAGANKIDFRELGPGTNGPSTNSTYVYWTTPIPIT